jgi:CO dehydrogenase/acetyl-CoA synthase beta subunit
MTDKTIINKLWWLNKMLNEHFKDKEYKDVHDKEVPEEVCKEIDELVEHIKLTK